ncbi:ATP-binding protein [Pyrococcus kukulkanii]
MFFNREKEIDELLRIMRGEPNVVTFVYGPINSGKTAPCENS